MGRLGQTHPVRDALRILTLAGSASAAGAGDENQIGGALQNKIYVWHADGSTLGIFDPDEAGLNAAITDASAVGDSVWLPSITIPLTAGVTVPVGVAIVGLSYNSVLSFSGFAGAAMTLQAGSILQNFTLVHSDGIGVQLAAESAQAIRLHITAATAVHVELPPVVTVANEIWRLDQRGGYSLMASFDFDFSGATNTATWHKFNAWPAGFDSAVSQLGEMAMTSDGQKLYITRDDKVWKCDNVAALRANPATTPTWTLIAQAGDSLGGGTIERIGHGPSGEPHGHLEAWGTLLVTTASVTVGEDSHRYYGEYDGSSWTWYQLSTANGQLGSPAYRRANYRANGAALDEQPVFDETGAVLHVFDQWGGGNANDVRMWRNETPGAAYTGTRKVSGGNMTINLADDGTELYETSYNGNHFINMRGALTGAHVYVLVPDGDFIYSTDGTTFALHSNITGIGTYKGEIRDGHKEGGGALILIRGNTSNGAAIQVAPGGVGDSFVTRNGNYWTVLGGVGSMVQCGAQVVFIP